MKSLSEVAGIFYVDKRARDHTGVAGGSNPPCRTSFSKFLNLFLNKK